MKSILVSPKNTKEYDFVLEILNRMNVKISELSEEQIEDFGMSYLMKEKDNGKKMTRKELNQYLENA
jgi:hypothetical protein